MWTSRFLGRRGAEEGTANNWGGLSRREMLGARGSGGLLLSGASWGWEKLVATSLAGVSPPSLIASKR